MSTARVLVEKHSMCECDITQLKEQLRVINAAIHQPTLKRFIKLLTSLVKWAKYVHAMKSEDILLHVQWDLLESKHDSNQVSTFKRKVRESLDGESLHEELIAYHNNHCSTWSKVNIDRYNKMIN